LVQQKGSITLNDLVEKIEWVLSEQQERKDMTERSYEMFKTYHIQPVHFINHFQNLIVFND
jgi:spore maturation protein CgeB